MDKILWDYGGIFQLDAMFYLSMSRNAYSRKKNDRNEPLKTAAPIDYPFISEQTTCFSKAR